METKSKTTPIPFYNIDLLDNAHAPGFHLHRYGLFKSALYYFYTETESIHIAGDKSKHLFERRTWHNMGCNHEAWEPITIKYITMF